VRIDTPEPGAAGAVAAVGMLATLRRRFKRARPVGR
jgi:hypothetical protein